MFWLLILKEYSQWTVALFYLLCVFFMAFPKSNIIKTIKMEATGLFLKKKKIKFTIRRQKKKFCKTGQ